MQLRKMAISASKMAWTPATFPRRKIHLEKKAPAVSVWVRRLQCARSTTAWWYFLTQKTLQMAASRSLCSFCIGESKTWSVRVGREHRNESYRWFLWGAFTSSELGCTSSCHGAPHHSHVDFIKKREKGWKNLVYCSKWVKEKCG